MRTAMIQPHHDGSDLYVSNSAPKIGDRVTLRVRVPRGDRARSLHVRLFQDGEPHTYDLKKDKVTNLGTKKEQWWRISIEIANLTTSYRFLLVDTEGFRWLNAAGVFAHDVADREDFQVIAKPKYPKWLKKAILYQIFPDRFATSGKKRELPNWAVPRQWNQLPQGRGKNTPVEFYGGDFEGVTQHLDHIQELGATAIYFTPAFPAKSNHRYDATSFDHIDPLLGGDDAFIEFSQAAHKRGMRIMGDLTSNHCGEGHPWMQESIKNPRVKEREFFYWDSSIPHGYVGWWGLASLPKLNYRSKLLREIMYSGEDSIIKKWLKPPFSMDGWRIDVGNMTGRYLADDFNKEVAHGIREAMDEVNPDAWLIAENADNAASDLDGFGWHGTMNQNGFGRPVAKWLRKPGKAAKNVFDDNPIAAATIDGESMVAILRAFSAGIPWRSLTASMLLLDSHDTARFRTVVGRDSARHLAAVTMLLTYPGVPSIFAGDEIGLEGAWGEDARRTIDWEQREKWDSTLLQEFKRLVLIRKNSDALCNGGLRWVLVKADSIAYLRESSKESILVHISRAAGRHAIDLSPYGYSFADTLYGPEAEGSSLRFSSKGAISGIWRLR